MPQSLPDSQKNVIPFSSEKPKNTTTPLLTAVLRADIEAIRNDLNQAQQLTSHYQHQLAGKSNECAQLRRVLEKTIRDLAKLQADIGELRKERHQLANEVMGLPALQRRLDESIRERDNARAQTDALRIGIKAKDAVIRDIRESFSKERSILTEENQRLKKALTSGRSPVSKDAAPRIGSTAEKETDAADMSFDDITYYP